MALSTNQFRDQLIASGLMTAEELSSLLVSLPHDNRPTDGEQLARELVRQKKLTKFQAEQIYAGKGASLTLGNYVILDKLGQGGMGMVLKAGHKRMKRLVALKVMSPAGMKSPDAVKRFHREVEAAAKLRHPNIVAADDADEAKGTHFLVMEYVEGTDLSAFVKKHGPMPVEMAVQCILQAARGLEFAHSQGVIHRDIKPANLLMKVVGGPSSVAMDSNGPRTTDHGLTVKILDMGLARIDGAVGGSSEGAGLTSTGTIMGTVDYMSPEQAMDTKHADARSDIYSLGCTLYYLLTGRCLYDGDTMMKKLMAHQHAPVPELSSPVAPRQDSRTSLDAGSSATSNEVDSASAIVSRSDTATFATLNAVFRRMVAKKPEDRPQSMTAVIAELERCLAGGPATVIYHQSGSSATNIAESGAAGGGNELQDFLRQISGGEPVTATSGKVSGTVVTPSSGEAETMISSADGAGTDPRTEQTLTLDRSGEPKGVRPRTVRGLTPTGSPKRKWKLLIGSIAAGVVVLLAVVFAVRGHSGTLILEVNDELIKVKLGETGRTVQGKTKHTLQVPLGELVLHIQREDLAFDTDPFDIPKGKPVTIKVERVGRAVRAMQGKTLLGRKEESRPGAPADPRRVPSGQPPADAVANDREREVAEWVISKGGDVTLVSQAAVIAKVADLPRQPFAVRAVTFRKLANFSEADALRLTKLAELQHVDFFDSTLSSGSIRALAGCRRLQHLLVHHGSTADTTLSESLQIPQLRQINFTGVAVSDEFLARLGQLPQLQSLQIHGCKLATEEGLVRMAVAPPPKLRRLIFTQPKVSAAGLRAIARLPHLQELSLRGTQLEDAALVELARCPSLARVSLAENSVTQVGTTELQKALAGCQIFVSKPEQAPPLYGPAYRDTIRQLMTRGIPIGVTTNSSGGMAWIHGDNPFPKGDVVFAEAVYHTFTPSPVVIEPDDLQRIAQLSDLRSLSFGKLPPDSLRELLPLKNLTNLSSTSTLTDADIGLLPSFPKLSSLGVVVPSDAALAKIARLPHLSDLTILIGSKITANGLKALESARVLSTVDLGHTDIPLAAAQSLANARPDIIVTVKGQRLDPDESKLNSQAPRPAVAPFDAAQARAHQEAWAKHLGVPVEYTNSIGMKFVLIPPGEFLMGSTAAEIEAALKVIDPNDKHWQECIKSEAPQHKVILTQPIYLGTTEVTQAQYEKIMGTNPSHFSASGVGKDAVAGRDTSTHPVEVVSWNDAAEFCSKLSQQEKLKPFYLRTSETITPLDGTGYRLPSEGEWEYACRAGTATKHWSGDKDEELVRVSWFGGNSGGQTHAVGELKANPFGLHDIHGNVWEWVQDGWDASWYSQFHEKAAINPSRPFSAGPQRVIRGGDWRHSESHCRSSIRYVCLLTLRELIIGFRVSLPVEAVKQQLAQKAATTPKPAVAPFDVAQARAHQEAWAKHLVTTVETTNSVGAKMILIPPGEFLMGSTNEQVEAALKAAEEIKANDAVKGRIEKAERPQHKVVLTKPFLLSATEMTIGQFKKFSATGYVTEAEKAAQNDSNTLTYLSAGSDDLPAAFITWNDAVAYCKWLSEQEKRTYRLPTEAEWEYACRAGTTTQYSFGDDYNELPKYGWHNKNASGKSHPVGTLLPNGFGLFDMHGNLFEWCGDYFDEKWYSASTLNDPIGPSAGSSRVIRGGWLNDASSCRSAFRNDNEPSSRYYIGFRCVAELNEPAVEGNAAQPKSTAWTDWLGPKLKRGDFGNNPDGWVREGDAVTTSQVISGIQVLPGTTRDAAMRVTYLLRDSKGIQINARDHKRDKTDATRELYMAEDNGTQLKIVRVQTGESVKALATQDVPASIPKDAPRTLEFRVVGDTLTATINGSVVATAKDSTITEGNFAMVALKRVLIQKVEYQSLDEPK